MIQKFQEVFVQQIREIYKSEDPLPLLSIAALQLQKFQRQISDIQTAYERRQAQRLAQTSAIQLRSAKQAKLPQKQFEFASRKYLEQEKVFQNVQTIESIDQNVIQNIKDQDNMIIQDNIIKIRNCSNSTFIFTERKTIFFFQCENCQFLSFNISGAVFVENLTNCTIKGSCHQLRITDCQFLKIQVNVDGPVIENSKNISFFKPENYINGWNDVKDFSWLRLEENPNWFAKEKFDEN
ncbi:Tubulin specific chaperone C [Spironucleus salmonicida]|uniref:Tubulin specific chaperone C n=1 Tax=Spironucleus salmonicida TaxID=348837 RepID=V6LZU9_9EUKA|nr:Tubulin specific chaperone C [Spironucleus salmonicida]|eukprot:EST49281.1 Tubulin specific chaperone C [Spironucleus salmonicida]